MRFDLVDLRLFLHVAESASITRGAARANLALASASERIRGMEEAAGVALLERGWRGAGLTPAGRALVHHARLVLQQVDHMKGELASFAGGLKGLVRVLANSAALSEILPDALGAFLAAHPGIDLDVEEGSSYDIARAIAAGFVEVGIVADIVDLGALERFPLAPDRLVAVLAPGHPLAARRRLPFRDLLDHPFVGLAAHSALQQHLAQHAAQAGRPLALRVRLSGFDAICRMVESGVGVAIVPERAARRCRDSMAIRIVRLTDPWSRRQLHVAVRDARALAPAARALVEHLRRGAADAAC